jgi:hypothetical protein
MLAIRLREASVAFGNIECDGQGCAVLYRNVRAGMTMRANISQIHRNQEFWRYGKRKSFPLETP